MYDTKRNKLDKFEIQAAFRTEEIAKRITFFAKKGTPVRLKVDVYLPLAKSTPTSLTSAPNVRKPDLDNVVKLVLDALNGVAWEDDQQVNCIFAKKLERRRFGNPHTHIRVEYQKEEESHV